MMSVASFQVAVSRRLTFDHDPNNQHCAVGPNIMPVLLSRFSN